MHKGLCQAESQTVSGFVLHRSSTINHLLTSSLLKKFPGIFAECDCGVVMMQLQFWIRTNVLRTSGLDSLTDPCLKHCYYT